MRNSILALAILFSLRTAVAAQQTTVNQLPIKRTSWASGQQMYHEYCAACHGENGAGGGPAASACTVKPADLTKLAAIPGSKLGQVRREWRQVSLRTFLRRNAVWKPDGDPSPRIGRYAGVVAFILVP